MLLYLEWNRIWEIEDLGLQSSCIISWICDGNLLPCSSSSFLICKMLPLSVLRGLKTNAIPFNHLWTSAFLLLVLLFPVHRSFLLETSVLVPTWTAALGAPKKHGISLKGIDRAIISRATGWWLFQLWALELKCRCFCYWTFCPCPGTGREVLSSD